MPNNRKHKIQAEHNRRLVDALWQAGKPVYADWVVTTAFYVAVHLIEEYLYSRNGIHSDDHANRLRQIASVTQLSPIYEQYSELYNRSKDSRYRCMPERWTATFVQSLLDKLETIEQHMSTLR